MLFRCIEYRSYHESRRILLIMVLGCSIIGITLEWRHFRNNSSVFINTAVSFWAYTALTYFSSNPRVFVVSVAVALILVVVYILFIIFYRIDPAKNYKAIRRRRICLAGRGTALILCFGFTVNMTVVGAHTAFGIALLEPTTIATNATKESGETIAKNIEILTLLADESWEACSAEKRVEVLQVIANIEQTYLGLPHPLHVGASYLQNGLYGYYDDSTFSIVINLEYLKEKPSYEMVDTICHEAFHGLQHCEIDAYDELEEELKHLLLFYEVALYKEEFANYPNCFDDFASYYDLEVEQSARAYAKKATIEYYERVYKYLAEPSN